MSSMPGRSKFKVVLQPLIRCLKWLGTPISSRHHVSRWHDHPLVASAVRHKLRRRLRFTLYLIPSLKNPARLGLPFDL